MRLFKARDIEVAPASGVPILFDANGRALPIFGESFEVSAAQVMATSDAAFHESLKLILGMLSFNDFVNGIRQSSIVLSPRLAFPKT